MLEAAAGAATSPSLQDWWSSGFFAWPGWAFVQALGALGTLGALAVLIAQLGLARGQVKQEAGERREDYQRSRTPDLSIEVIGVTMTAATCPRIDMRVNADGGGVAYNVIMNVRLTDVGPPPVGEAHLVTRYLRAPGSSSYHLDWPHGWGQERPVQIEVPYRSVFGKQYRLTHSGCIGGPEGLRITNEPVVEEIPALPVPADRRRFWRRG